MSLGSFTREGKYLMAALDHRGSLKKLFLDEATKKDIIAWKELALKYLVPEVSGVLLDVEIGLKAYNNLKLRKPFLLAIEKSGYGGGKENRLTRLAYNVGELKRMGAGGVKLLIYYNPYVKSAGKQRELVKRVALDCKRHKIPFLLEIVTYQIKAKKNKKISKVYLIKKSLEDILSLEVKVDVYKIEFPGKEGEYITERLGKIPWILLSAGVSFPVFKKQVRESFKNGARGFLAGRALWQDFAKHKNREKFFKNIVTRRIKELVKLAI